MNSAVVVVVALWLPFPVLNSIPLHFFSCFFKKGNFFPLFYICFQLAISENIFFVIFRIRPLNRHHIVSDMMVRVLCLYLTLIKKREGKYKSLERVWLVCFWLLWFTSGVNSVSFIFCRIANLFSYLILSLTSVVLSFTFYNLDLFLLFCWSVDMFPIGQYVLSSIGFRDQFVWLCFIGRCHIF